MTIASTDGRAALFYDGYLDLKLDDGAVAYPCELWRDNRGRFIAIVPVHTNDDAAPYSSAHTIVAGGIAAAVRAACSGYCDLILEHRPATKGDPFVVADSSPMKVLDRVDLEAAGLLIPDA